MVRTLGKLTGAVLSAALLALASCSLVLGLEEAKIKPTASDGGGGGGIEVECRIDGDCVGIAPECQKYTCKSNVCELGNGPDGIKCSLNGGIFCLEGMCSGASCIDERLNGDETDVDCGGSCSPCQLNQLCNSAKDCLSLKCEKICIDPCTNMMQDGSESDIDCGGSCPPCLGGRTCFVPEDCFSKVCNAGICK